MLVLSRKIGESIVIGDGIRITITALERGRVRLGVSAPANVPVNREEVAQRIGSHTEREPAGVR